jgi:hypothetical protein
MLTPKEIDALDALARDLAKRGFGGEASVARRGSGTLRLIIVKHDHGGGSVFRERDMAEPTFEAATKEIALAIQCAASTSEESAVPA